MKNKKKKGYVLAVVMILTFIMTITVTSAFTIVMRYMFFAKNDLEKLGTEAIYYNVDGEADIDACI